MDYIVRESASEIRALARYALRGNWKRVTGVIVLFVMLLAVLPSLLDALFPNAVISQDLGAGQSIETPIVSSLYSFLFTAPFEVGAASFLIAFVRRKEINGALLFEGFTHFFKAFFLMIAIYIRIALWSLLFVVPGIIAAFRYSQAFYILADHPEFSVGECIKQSKLYMQHNKWKFFTLTLSYIGWILLLCLVIIICSLIVALLCFSLPVTVITVILLLVCSLPIALCLTYMCTGEVMFYELVSKNLVAESEKTLTESPDEYNF